MACEVKHSLDAGAVDADQHVLDLPHFFWQQHLKERDKSRVEIMGSE